MHAKNFHHLYGIRHIWRQLAGHMPRRKFHDIHLMHASPTTTSAGKRSAHFMRSKDEIRGKPVDLRLSVRYWSAEPNPLLR